VAAVCLGVCVNPRRSESKSIQVTRHCSVKRHPARVGCVGFPRSYSSLHTWRLELPEAQSTNRLLVPLFRKGKKPTQPTRADAELVREGFLAVGEVDTDRRTPTRIQKTPFHSDWRFREILPDSSTSHSESARESSGRFPAAIKRASARQLVGQAATAWVQLESQRSGDPETELRRRN